MVRPGRAHGPDRPAHDALQPVLLRRIQLDFVERRRGAHIHRSRRRESWRGAASRPHRYEDDLPELGPRLRARPPFSSQRHRAAALAVQLGFRDQLSGHLLLRKPRGLCRRTAAQLHAAYRRSEHPLHEHAVQRLLPGRCAVEQVVDDDTGRPLRAADARQ